MLEISCRGSFTLRIGLINIQGLQSERTNKINSPEFIKICENHDILLLTETWTSDLCDVSIDGFDHIVLNRTEKKPGTRRNSGVLIEVCISNPVFLIIILVLSVMGMT